ncbi:hypothetical protein Kpol_344p10, partial [Vanderwaltozyma polyspora DSM 70294]
PLPLPLPLLTLALPFSNLIQPTNQPTTPFNYFTTNFHFPNPKRQRLLFLETSLTTTTTTTTNQDHLCTTKLFLIRHPTVWTSTALQSTNKQSKANKFSPTTKLQNYNYNHTRADKRRPRHTHITTFQASTRQEPNLNPKKNDHNGSLYITSYHIIHLTLHLSHAMLLNNCQIPFLSLSDNWAPSSTTFKNYINSTCQVLTLRLPIVSLHWVGSLIN